MSDFLTEKIKKQEYLGNWNGFFCGFFYTFFPWELLAHRRSILVKGAGEWQQQRSYLDCCFCIQPSGKYKKALKKKKGRRDRLLVWILCPEYRFIWKTWAGTGKRCSEKAGKIYCGGIYPEYSDRQRRKLYYDHCTEQTRKWEDLYYSYLPQLRCKESGDKRSSEHLWILRTASYPMTKDTFRICPVKDKILVQYAQCIKRIF